MKKKLLPAIVLLVLALSYGIWAFWYTSTSLDNIQCDSRSDAYEKAKAYLQTLDGNKHIISTSGSSNNIWSTKILKGYVIIDGDIKYEDLKPNMFVVYRSPIGLIHHRLRHKTDEGWVVEGDGNSNIDRYLVTKDNYIGITYESKVWRY